MAKIHAQPTSPLHDILAERNTYLRKRFNHNIKNQMIEFEMNPKISTQDWKNISELFVLVDWGLREPKDIAYSFEKSKYVLLVKEEGKIVGFGRTVDDGKYYALIVDVVVHPNFQQQGIGKKIVSEISSCLKGYEFITLTSAPNKGGFYEKIGWRKQKSAYILPKDQKQIDEHCE